jgi:signal transduction histidine kinase/ActR/RegA family two-component response regulator
VKIFDVRFNCLFIKTASILIIATGFAALAGWALDIAPLRSVIHGAVEMKANTAICVILASIAAYLLAGAPSDSGRRIAEFLATLVGVIGLLTLLEYVFGFQPGVDELLFRDTANAYNALPGRMSPYTAITFIACGLALVLLGRRRMRPLVQLLAYFIGVIGAVSFIGYAWNASEIVTDVLAPPVAINTALCFILLGLSMLVLNRADAGQHSVTHDSVEFRLITGFVCTLLLLIIIGGDLYRSVSEFSAATKWVSHTQEVRADLSDLYANFSDAEAAQRNYLLTGEGKYAAALQRYDDIIHAQLRSIARLVSDNPSQSSHAMKLRDLVTQRLEEMNRFDSKLKMTGARAARTQVTDGTDPQLRQDIRTVARQMDDAESALLAKRQEQVAHSQKSTLVALLLMIIAVSAIFVFLFYSINHEQTLRTQREKELAEAKTFAENANQAKSAFLSSMSHELRTPLNAILGFSQILASETLPSTPAQKKEFVGHIIKAGRHLLSLINEILDLTKIESGAIVLSLEPVSISDILQECQTMIEPMGTQRNISVSFPQPNDLHAHADRTRLRQVLLNLLSNAIKYNRAGGTVTVTCHALQAERIRITVQDTGPGLRPEQVDQLFQPFNRLGQEGGKEEGSGIGLVVTKRLVELMKGTIGVSSTAGKGSTFWIDLPSALPQKSDKDMQPASQPSNRAADAEDTPTLLYIEDNPANLRLVQELLRLRNGLKMISAPEGHLGIELAKTHQPDLVLMDLNLPGMSGEDARKVLQAHPKTAHIPIIAVTANAMPRDIRKGLEAGFFRYITKPINIDEFNEAIDSALKLTAKNLSQ